MARHVAVLILGLTVLAVSTGGRGPIGQARELHAQQSAAALTTATTLQPGFNLVGWTGSESIAAADAAAAIPGATAIFDFDAATQQFRSYRPGALAILNTLVEIMPGSAVWVQTDGFSEWTQPATTESTTITFQPGFNLVVWGGASGTAVEEALGEVTVAVAAVYRYEAATGEFQSYGPGRPAFLNDLATLNYGDGLYVLTHHVDTWEQPAPPAGGNAPFLDGQVEVSAGVGVDAATLDAITVQEIDATQLPEALQGVTPVGPVLEITGPEGGLTAPLEVSLHLTAAEVAGVQPEGGTSAFVLLTTDAEGNPELLGDPTTTVSLDDGSVMVTGTATHFSNIVAVQAGVTAYLSERLPDPMGVGQQASATLVVESGLPIETASGTPNFSLFRTGFEAQGAFGAVPLVVVSHDPDGLSMAARGTTTAGLARFEARGTWSCIAAGGDTYGAFVYAWINEKNILQKIHEFFNVTFGGGLTKVSLVVEATTRCAAPTVAYNARVGFITDPVGQRAAVGTPAVGGEFALAVTFDAATCDVAAVGALTAAAAGPSVHVAQSGCDVGITGPDWFVPVEGECTADLSSCLFSGMGTVAGIPNVSAECDAAFTGPSQNVGCTYDLPMGPFSFGADLTSCGGTDCASPATFALFIQEFIGPFEFTSTPTTNIFIGPSVHVVSTPAANLDMQTQLPITLRLVNLATGETHEWTIPNDPANYCESMGECSTPIDALGTIERGSVWRLTATGQGGTRLAQQDFTAQ